MPVEWAWMIGQLRDLQSEEGDGVGEDEGVVKAGDDVLEMGVEGAVDGESEIEPVSSDDKTLDVVVEGVVGVWTEALTGVDGQSGGGVQRESSAIVAVAILLLDAVVHFFLKQEVGTSRSLDF